MVESEVTGSVSNRSITAFQRQVSSSSSLCWDRLYIFFSSGGVGFVVILLSPHQYWDVGGERECVCVVCVYVCLQSLTGY